MVSLSGHGRVQGSAAPEAAAALPAPPPPPEGGQQRSRRYTGPPLTVTKTAESSSHRSDYTQVCCSLTGSYEPPLTNVFTMQWFLTMFATCLPAPTVLKIWDSVFFEGSEVLFRVALAIWERLGEWVQLTGVNVCRVCVCFPVSWSVFVAFAPLSVQEDRVLSDGRRVLQHYGVSHPGDAGAQPGGLCRAHAGTDRWSGICGAARNGKISLA